MRYLNEKDLIKIGIDWKDTVGVIEHAVQCMDKNDYAQPIKPYLRFGDLKNRIIAMPAFVGGNINMAGIKWIASFPSNIIKNIPRAHSVVILNDFQTGEPIVIINTSLLSVIRTASVSGLILNYFDKVRKPASFRLEIIGWGPIGQYHFTMVTSLFDSKIFEIYLYDKRPIIQKDTIPEKYYDKVKITNNWEEVYKNSDVFITCTVASEPYIDKSPNNGSLLLNVSLRDFKPVIYDYVRKSIIVDDWEEVCRENTDIENMHKQKGLKKEDTKSISDIICRNAMNDYDINDTIMFNPMGMAIFDVALGSYYLNKAIDRMIGLNLE